MIKGQNCLRWLFYASFILLLASCSQPDGSLQSVLDRKELVVLTRNAPTTYYELRDETTGPEHDLVKAFADELNVNLKFKVLEGIDEILEALSKGEGDLAAAGLTTTAERQEQFLFGPNYQQVKQQVVCRRGGATPKSLDDMNGIRLVVAAQSSYAERLKHLKEDDQELQWETSTTKDTEQLLEKVWRKKLDCTVADSNIVAINRRYYPELSVRFDLNDEEHLAWVFPKGSSGLQDRVSDWHDDYKDSGALQTLLDRYYGYVEIFDYVDTRTFKRRIAKRLPKYQKLFEKVSKEFHVDWTLIAAQSYQESHWNRRAKSPTGVRGMMMLTLTTAKELGIESRLNAKQSIRGGAMYLSRLRKRLPESITEPDRTWMALAAYNVGMGHLYDARKLARQIGKNPDLWRDLAEALPLLSQKRYYKTLKHGYARGNEPVRYVQRIRDYQNILQQSLFAKN